MGNWRISGRIIERSAARGCRARPKVISRLPEISAAAVLVLGMGVLGMGAGARLAGAEQPEPAKLVQTACTSCHTLEVIEKKQATKEEWREVVNSMGDKGAALKPEEAAAVTEYLGSKYGNRAKELV